MLQGEHSAILSTFIKLPFAIKIFVLSICEWSFYTGFTVYAKIFFILVWYVELGMVHCIYLGVSGYNFSKLLHLFVWISNSGISSESSYRSRLTTCRVNQGSSVRNPASTVCRMRLKAVAPSPYELSCWWTLNTNTTTKSSEYSLFAIVSRMKRVKDWNSAFSLGGMVKIVRLFNVQKARSHMQAKYLIVSKFYIINQI